MIFKKRAKLDDKVSLLPYEKQPLYGFSRESGQILGWHITRFGIEEQWEYATGENCVVAVIDTGCDMEHPDLKENLLPGANVIDLNASPQDDNGHGSHVCGTIAGLNNSLGVVGVAPGAKIFPIKALDSKGNGTLGHLLSAIELAIKEKVDFITMSLGSPRPSDDLQKLLNEANKKGIICFCAAGNSGENVDIMYPARYDSVISIGAIDEQLNRTDFTCSGDSLDFLAPGHNIISTVPNGYATMSGTSMSNPFAAAYACLLSDFNRRSKKFSLKNVDSYIEILKKQAMYLQDSKHQNKKYQGNGILNLKLNML